MDYISVLLSTAAVPTVDYTFLDEERAADKKTYVRIGNESKMWMERETTEAVQSESTSATKYARALMWQVIMTPENLIKVHAVKERGLGFLKLFGKRYFDEVYRT